MRNALVLGSVSLTSATIPIMFDSSLRWIVVFGVAALVTALPFRVSAAARHVAWMISLTALLLMPVLAASLPDWRVLPWRASVGVGNSHQPTTTGDANESPAHSVDSTELASALDPLLLEMVNGDVDHRGTPVPSIGKAYLPKQGLSVLADNLGLLWALGFAICMMRLIAGRIVVGRLAADSDLTAAASLQEAVASARSRLGLETPIRVYVTWRRQMPMAWGVWRPAVLLPGEALSWDKDQLEAVLLHELGHIRRHDPLTHLLAQLACALHWFNPLAWFAAWRLGIERERACDDLVLLAGLKPSAYAEQLLAIVSRFDSPRRLPSTALAMAPKGRIDTRIAAILNARTTRQEMTMPNFLVTLLVATATTFAAATLNAQQEPAVETVEQQDKRPQVEQIPNPLLNPGFEEGEPNRLDFGWKMGAVSELDPKVGKRCGLLTSANQSRRPALIQGVDAKAYLGKRIRYRAAVRVESDEGNECQAQLWFRVDRNADGDRQVVGAFDNMHDRPIKSSEWKYYDLVGDVHDDAKTIVVGMFFRGKGKVWIDDVSVEVVGEDVGVTTIGENSVAAVNAARPTEVRNPGFEQGKVDVRIEGWHAASRNGYQAIISDKNPKLGKQCGLLQRDPGEHQEKQFGALNSSLDATPFRGKRVCFRAAVRTKVEGEGNAARLWFRVDRPAKDGKPSIGAFDNMHDRPITANQWQHYEIVGDVAADAQVIVFGLLLNGDGKAFLDDVSFEVVGEDVEPTAKVISAATTPSRPRGTPIGEIGPGLFEIIGSMEVVSTGQSPADEDSDEATLLLPLPLSYRDQVPLSYHLIAEPAVALKSAEIYQDQPSNFVAKVVLTDLSKHKKVDVTFRSSVLVGPSSFEDAAKTRSVPDAWPEEAEKWLASTWCVEADHDRIESIAKEIREETDDVLQIIASVERKAHSIFRSATGHVRNLTAVEALDKRGSCTSCGNLVAALLRACDVPARVLSGYPSWSGPLQTHYIVEAYLPDFGWYPIESTMCRSPWPNSHQINVAIIPPEYEAVDVAGSRRSAAGGVPYLSLTERVGSGSFYSHGTIQGAPHCDHHCKLIRRFDSSDAQWSKTMDWAKPRWASWLSSGQPIENGQLAFGATAEEIKADSPKALLAELSH